MEVLTDSLAGLGAFLLYFSLSIAFLMLFKVVYVRFTPHDEWKLVKEGQNIAAAIGLSGSIIGYCLAIAGAASNSVNLIDFAFGGLWPCLPSSSPSILSALVLCLKSLNVSKRVRSLPVLLWLQPQYRLACSTLLA